MSKKNHGGPKAQSPAPPETPPQATPNATTGAATLPEAKPVIENTHVPPVPPLVIGLSRAVREKWGVPVWLTQLASWTGSRFHTATPGTNNACGIMATGTMQKNLEGWAWFGNIPISYDQFGFACSKLGLDYSKPEKCIEALKTVCPKINTESYTLFKEA